MSSETQMAEVMSELKAQYDAAEAARIAVARVEIVTYRKYGDDDDTLAYRVFGAGDPGTLRAQIAEEKEIEFASEDSEKDATGYYTAESAIIDGEILTSLDGRRWLVTIQEYLGGEVNNV